MSFYSFSPEEQERLTRGIREDIAAQEELLRDRAPHWLFDKARRQARRREDLEGYERAYRDEAGLPDGPLDLEQQVGLDLALRFYERFMDRVFWGEDADTFPVHKLAQWDPRPPVEPNPALVAYFERATREALAWFEDVRPLPEYRGTSPLARYESLPDVTVRLEGHFEAWEVPVTVEHEALESVREAFEVVIRADGFVPGSRDVESDQGSRGATNS